MLALPNGKAAPFVAAIDTKAPDTVAIDLSADYRFDDGWYYGLPELTRGRYDGQRRISNPGCYATAMQLAIAPMLDTVQGPVQCFGVSGYSGAGTSPSDKNDPDKLRDNLIPYALTGHVHEREVTRQLGHAIEFMPHVAPHFRGLTITANLHLSRRIRAQRGRRALPRTLCRRAAGTDRRGSAMGQRNRRRPSRRHRWLHLVRRRASPGSGGDRGQSAQGCGHAGPAEPQSGVRAG